MKTAPGRQMAREFDMTALNEIMRAMHKRAGWLDDYANHAADDEEKRAYQCDANEYRNAYYGLRDFLTAVE